MKPSGIIAGLHACILCLSLCMPAKAHPLGNDSVTHFSVLHISPEGLEVDLVLDLAEYPSEQIGRREMDADADGLITPQEQRAWLDRNALRLAQQLKASLDGQSLSLRPAEQLLDPRTGRPAGSPRVIVESPGVAGMPTYKIILRCRAGYPSPLGEGRYTLHYRDDILPDKPGLMRILLERTGAVARLTDALPLARSQMEAGKVPNPLRTLLAGKGLPLSSAASIAGGPANDRWWLTDDGRTWEVEADQTGLSVYRLPRARILPPRPSFWDENALSPFIYEQYDVANMPREQTATIRFEVIPAGSPPASGDGQPTAAAADDSVERILIEITDPRNDPSRTSPYVRDASWLIARIREPWGLGLFLTVTAACFAWGAWHALMPGHAKTLVAAYLISRRGTWWHAIVLALVVTLTHTALVVIMGVVIWAYQRTNPALGPILQLWLGAAAGLLMAALGLSLTWRAARDRLGHDHGHHHGTGHGHSHGPGFFHPTRDRHAPPVPAHGIDHHRHSLPHEHGLGSNPHDHHHDHGPHSHGLHRPGELTAVPHHPDAPGGEPLPHPHLHTHPHPHPPHGDAPPAADPSATEEPIRTATLVLMGISGGIVPCPTATIIMLLGIGANVVLGALYAVSVFSLGLALALMAVGMLALGSRRFAARLLAGADGHVHRANRGRWFMNRLLPALSGLAVLTLGAAIATHYLYFLWTRTALFSWLQ